MARILVIDDNETMREGIAHTVRRMGHEVDTAASGQAGLKAFEERAADFVISDLKMEGMDGIEVLQAIKAKHPEVLLMIVTGFGTIETAVSAMKLGAFDFITKPFPPEVLRLKVQAALDALKQRNKVERLERHNEILRAELDDRYRPVDRTDLVGSSPAMLRVLQTVQKVAAADSTVYIYGESGTGKELVARALHRTSRRAEGPFIKVNCGALAETLLESELFGHEKGSFTSAIKRKLGRFELADGGTLFLDEIGDISPAIQLKLLRVLQEREFERVGGEETIRVDVRVISATNKDLRAAVDAGTFREDLFYRLHIVPITLPPLRERAADIEPLAQHFITKLRDRAASDVREISPGALEALQRYPWPGNVRELENAIEQSLVFAEGDTLEKRDLPAHVTGTSLSMPTLPDDDMPLTERLETLEKALIERAFDQAEGVKTECARLLGIKTSALYYKLEKYGIGQ
ncbi:MAG: sigma-54-dependent Fis family transcriptional regulator [Myxococcales bacterium]|nr:sigma-54-dependent Fis family transcriptional regulator [Myxococcales bacterium]